MQVIAQYKLTVDNIEVGVRVISEKGVNNKYQLLTKELSEATKALLDNIRDQLVSDVEISSAEILDPNAVLKIKEKFRISADEFISKKLPKINEETKQLLIGTLLHETIGLGKIEFLLADPHLEEIVVNSAKEPIKVYHKNVGWLDTDIMMEDEEQVLNYANTIARRIGRQVTTLNPLLDAHLITGDRANAVLYPISNRGNSLTIRMFARDPWTCIDYIKNKTCNVEVFALIWMVMEYELNMLISGGTGSGKTSMLNVCMPFIPPNHRIISIEDTRELQLPKYLHWVPLVTRLPNTEGKGEVTMLDLLINSLRMRPDRIVLGEMRRKEEAEVLFEAMHTGHSVYSTVHAESVSETIQRLVYPPIDIPANLLPTVNLCLVMYRERRRGIRRVFQLGEFIRAETEDGIAVRPNIIYRWNPSTDKIEESLKASKLFEELSLHTGLNKREIDDKIEENKKILNWMLKYDVRDVHSIGKIMNEYYFNYEGVIDTVRRGLHPDTLVR
jgi:flagellar protein FlaI